MLILGRFADPQRKAVLDALRESLRGYGFLPIIFDFDPARERDITETVKILAGMSLFIISDITSPRSNPLELQATVPDYMVPFVPIIQKGEQPFAMFADLQHKYRWVMDIRAYESKEDLIAHLQDAIIQPALALHNELLEDKAQTLRIQDISAFKTG